ncbi:MAG TPA: DUF1707 domain-containing protein [Solirubrobacteraceae bacterium]|jgi:hypothetical protein
MSDLPSSSTSARNHLRASDEDREQLVSELHEHSVSGRLSTEDLEERTQAAYSAQTLGELDALRRDLPTTQRVMQISQAARRSQLTRRLIQETGSSLGLFAVCTVIWFAGDAHRGQFWPVWVLLIVVMSLVRNGWALFGPAPDLDAVQRQLDRRRQHRLERGERRRGREPRG